MLFWALNYLLKHSIHQDSGETEIYREINFSYFTIMTPQCIFELVEWQLLHRAQKIAVADWEPKSLSTLSTEALQSHIQYLSVVLVEQGLKSGDIVVMMSRHSSMAEFALEMAVMKLGATICPLHSYYQLKELKEIILELNPSLILCQTSNSKKKILSIVQQLPLPFPNPKIHLYEDLQNRRTSSSDIVYTKVKPEACALIMYTSGSSGSPKGVMLSHQNILSNVAGLLDCMPIKRGDRVISYLPRSHVMERTATYTYLSVGAALYFVPSSIHLQEAIHTIRPKWMTAVPLVLERLHAHIFNEVEKGKWYERLLFQWSKKSGIPRLIARLLIVNAWKRKFGPGLKGVIVGGAALSPEIARFFSSSGIRVREGYGLTETSPAITFNRYRRRHNRFGTVGTPIKNVEVRIQNPNDFGEGEIEVKGPNVMIGYFNNAEATQLKLTSDDWFQTGDIGLWVGGKFLKITDRASNIYKNASGRFVAPSPIERLITSHVALQQALVYGFNRPYNIALIIPDFDWLQTWAEENQIHWTDNAYMIHNPKVIALFDQILREMNKTLKSHERIERFILGKTLWTLDDGLLSITMKLRRKEILRLFEKQISALFEKPIER